MESGASLNVDISKFMGQDMEADMEEIVSNLGCERASNYHFLLKMLEEGLHSDIKLTAQGGSVKGHRCVLSAISPVFRAMFEHDMKEQLTLTVDIPDMTIEALQLFLLVLYTTNEVTCGTDPCYPSAIPWLFTAGIDKHFDVLFKAILKYQVEMVRLGTLLEAALQRNLTPDNCWGYYAILVEGQNRSIFGIVHTYIVSNFHEVLHSAEFLSEMRRYPDRVFSILVQVDQKYRKKIKKLSAARQD